MTMHRFLFLLPLLALCWGHGLIAQDQPLGPVNMNFEQGELGVLPKGWISPTQVERGSDLSGFVAGWVNTDPVDGSGCALLESTHPGEPERFGNLMQSFSAQNFRGKVVRFRAYVRVQDAADNSAPARLWMRVNRPEKQMGFFDNMRDRPIGNSGWASYSITGPIAPDAERISLGLMMLGPGKAWIDKVSFEVMGHAGKHSSPPSPLEGAHLTNLLAFTKLLGVVRYFHPSDEAAKTNWDRFAIEGVDRVEPATSPEELAKTLSDLFAPIAPTVQIFVQGQGQYLHPALFPLEEISLEHQVLYWHHHGIGMGREDQVYESVRRDRLRLLKLLVPDLEKTNLEEVFAKHKLDFHFRAPLTVDLPGGVTAVVPLDLWADENGTLPNTTDLAQQTLKPDWFTPTGNDRSTRLAGVMLAWNLIQHFYPYLDVIDTPWQEVLPWGLQRAATDPNAKAFQETLERLVAKLQDGHGNAWAPGDHYVDTPPLLWDWVEEKLVITKVAAPLQSDLSPGDIVVSVDGVPSKTYLEYLEERISGATPQWLRAKSISGSSLMGQAGTELTLEILDLKGSIRQVRVARVEGYLEKKRPPAIHQIKRGIWYVNLGKVTKEAFDAAQGDLSSAKGVVLDLREYPGGGLGANFLGHLTDTPIQTARWMIPLITLPDQKGKSFYFSNWAVQPQQPRFKGKVAFITNGGAISYMETLLAMVEYYQLGEIVGATTAGTNGNINRFTLPGDYMILFTGMQVLKHDGSQHHRVGIQPTIPVSRTVKGVKAGRDELLEKAIDVVSIR